jgi:hypothetical protein
VRGTIKNMSENLKRSNHETALASKEFLEAISEVMVRQQIDSSLALNLFGFFARKLIAIGVDNGGDESALTIHMVDRFMQGLGVEVGVAQIEGEQAEHLMAEFDRANSGTSLQ